MAKAKQNKKKPTNVAPVSAVAEDQVKTGAPTESEPATPEPEETEPVATPAIEKTELAKTENTAPLESDQPIGQQQPEEQPIAKDQPIAQLEEQPTPQQEEQPITLESLYTELQSLKATVSQLQEQLAKQRKASFTSRTLNLLQEYLSTHADNDHPNIWGMRRRGIQIMLYRLEKKTGLPCSPHTFRRTFASNLHRQGLDVEHIMRLGGWESLDMVLRYTRSVKFEESLRLYKRLDTKEG